MSRPDGSFFAACNLLKHTKRYAYKGVIYIIYTKNHKKV